MFDYILILPKKMAFSNQILGSLKDVVRVWAGGTSTTPKLSAAHLAKQNTKFGGGESEGGAGIHFPLTPFSARPARAFWFLARKARYQCRSKKVRAFSNKGHQTGLPDFWEAKATRCSPRLRARLARNEVAKSNGGTKSQDAIFSKMRRFVIAKQ